MEDGGFIVLAPNQGCQLATQRYRRMGCGLRSFSRRRISGGAPLPPGTTRSGEDGGTLLRGQAERMYQETNRVFAWGRAQVALQIANGAHAHPGAFGQFLLREPNGLAVAPDQRAEILRIRGGNVAPHTAK